MEDGPMKKAVLKVAKLRSLSFAMKAFAREHYSLLKKGKDGIKELDDLWAKEKDPKPYFPKAKAKAGQSLPCPYLREAIFNGNCTDRAQLLQILGFGLRNFFFELIGDQALPVGILIEFTLVAAEAPATASGTVPVDSGAFQLPWAAIPRFSPGVTDVTEYSGKLQFLAAMWPQEHLHLLAPRAALLCEGTAFKKVSKISADKLKTKDESGIKLLVATLGGSWGKTALEEKYDTFEKAIYSTAQKADETNDSYLARHDVHFEELLAQGVTMEEVRAYVLLRQSQLSAEDRKKIVVEMGGKLEYSKVVSAIRLLGSRFFADLQGQRTARTKTYDANVIEETSPDEPERAYQATAQGLVDEAEPELDGEFIEAMVAAEDPDALVVQGFEEELEGFFQDTPDLQEALVSYLEARQKLLSKKRSRGFWPVSAGKGNFKGSKGSKGRGKGGKGGRDQLLARIARSHCRICGAKGHWKAECPQKGKTSASAEATTTVAEALTGETDTVATDRRDADEVLEQVPANAMSLAEAYISWDTVDKQGITDRLQRMVANLRKAKPQNAIPFRPKRCGAISLTEPVRFKRAQDQAERVDVPALALFSTTATDAILDTGASRCVMGKSLVKSFLNQLSEAIRAQVKIVKSSVRFRFGNNQTLLSDRRILMPFQTAARQIPMAPKRAPVVPTESVPSSTPVLSLSARFSRLQDPSVAFTLEEVQTMPLDQLGETKILFGKAMKGRSFSDVYTNEHAWVHWILDHMSTSTKMEHVAFITFVRRSVEEAEQTEAALLQPSGSGGTPGASAKAAPKSQCHLSLEGVAWETSWDVVHEQDRPDSALQEQVTLLGERLSQMAFAKAEKAAWDVFQDLMANPSLSAESLSYEAQLRVLRDEAAGYDKALVDGALEYQCDGLLSESILLASETVFEPEPEIPELLSFTTLEAAEFAEGPPLAEDNLPYVHVRVKDLSREEVALFDQAKQKELQCRATVLQTIASCKFPLSSFDIKTAFLRGKADEGNPLAMEPPPELRKLLNLQEDEVCQLVGNAYGRVDAPLLFYKELCKQLGKLGFEPHPLEPCVFVLKTGSRLRGILGVHVDDGVCGGDAYFHQKVEELQQVLPFGSRKHQNFVFTGIQLEQFPDHSIRASQSDYVHRIPSIDIGRLRRQDLDAPVNEDERTKLRGLIGSLQYAVTHTRPDVAARLGEVQCQTTTATVQTLLLANKVLREAQEHHQVSIVFRAIPVEQLTFVAFGDASFASSKNLNSHQGVLICATDGEAIFNGNCTDRAQLLQILGFGLRNFFFELIGDQALTAQCLGPGGVFGSKSEVHSIHGGKWCYVCAHNHQVYPQYVIFLR
ncbi:RE1 [Symbiodinium sp. CCMP2592]|nr:RE1 [Symbiodinium sp. CCMP2592]